MIFSAAKLSHFWKQETDIEKREDNYSGLRGLKKLAIFGLKYNLYEETDPICLFGEYLPVTQCRGGDERIH